MIAPLSGPADLHGRTAFVSGASRGIGRAVCMALGREGAMVACADVLDVSETIAGLSAMGATALDLACDVRVRDQVAAAINRAVTAWGRLDILVCNAGILGDSRASVDALGLEEWDTVLEVNLRGQFLLVQAAWPHMLAQQGGKIVCMGSIAGRIGGILAGPHYCASKGGIHAMVKALAKRGAPAGIYVNGIAPGPVATSMTAAEPYKDEMVPLGRLGQPEDIAEAVVFLSSQASHFITGQVLDVNGGMLMV
jgi:NAD(P)-dependent dehydrogenase (short-subunit alcohol dehydrogenase family)